MRVKYLGPRQEIPVGGFGIHRLGEIKNYPEEIARDLAASRRQQFQIVEEKKAGHPRSSKKRKSKVKPA